MMKSGAVCAKFYRNSSKHLTKVERATSQRDERGSVMKSFKAIFSVAVVLVVAGCSQSRFDDSSYNAGANGVNGNIGAGGISDPASPAYFRETVGDRILFLVDQSTVNPQAQSVLQGQARWLAANPEYTITIEGHADEQGTRDYNLALGARRANAAREYLISLGVDGSRINVVTFGKERPVEICSNESCYSQNRRAVTVLASGLLG